MTIANADLQLIEWQRTGKKPWYLDPLFVGSDVGRDGATPATGKNTAATAMALLDQTNGGEELMILRGRLPLPFNTAASFDFNLTPKGTVRGAGINQTFINQVNTGNAIFEIFDTIIEDLTIESTPDSESQAVAVPLNFTGCAGYDNCFAVRRVRCIGSSDFICFQGADTAICYGLIEDCEHYGKWDMCNMTTAAGTFYLHFKNCKFYGKPFASGQANQAPNFGPILLTGTAKAYITFENCLFNFEGGPVGAYTFGINASGAAEIRLINTHIYTHSTGGADKCIHLANGAKCFVDGRSTFDTTKLDVAGGTLSYLSGGKQKVTLDWSADVINKPTISGGGSSRIGGS